MVYYIRKFKGCEENPLYDEKKTIDLNGGISQWDSVTANYIAYKNNTQNRDAKGYGSNYYKDDSGRNDIISAKAANDADYIYFMAECNDNITPNADKNRMNLYIDVNDGHGWETFDYVINHNKSGSDKAYLQKFTGNGYETTDISEIDYKIDGKYITYAVKKTDLGLSTDAAKVCFKWTDNVMDEDGSGEFKGEILDFYRTGDVAPGGRFKYVYSFTESKVPDTVSVTDTETESNGIPSGNNTNTVVIICVVCVVICAAAVIAAVIKRRK